MLIQKLASPAALGPLPVAAAMRLIDEAGLALAVVLTVAGMAMHWHLPCHRMSMEERAKDGKLTEAQANRRVTILGRCALVTTIAGVAALLLVLWDFNN